MVSAWWVLLAFFLGGFAGMLMMAIVALAKDLPVVAPKVALRGAVRRTSKVAARGHALRAANY